MAAISRLSAILTVAALALSPAMAKDFSDADTGVMNHALIDYALNRPGNYLFENKGFDFYLLLQDHDADAAFIAGFPAAAGKLKPFSAAQGIIQAQLQAAHVMKVTISDYHALGADQARVFVDARCGMLCGGQNVATLQKTTAGWSVVKFETLEEE